MVQNYLRLFETHDNEDNCKNGLRLKQLSNSVRNPRNYHEEQFVFNTPTSRLCRTSIYNMLEELDEMSYQALSATNRKLRSVSLVPQFRPVRCTGKRDLLIERVRKRFKKFLSKLKDGDVLPEALAKALSIIYLSFKHRSRHIDMLTSEVYPFSPQTVGLHNDIIKALWLLPKVKYDELKALQALLDPKAEVPIKCFRNTLRKYLMEYLFECSEGHVTEEVLKTLDFINRRMQTQTFVFSKETIKEDIEAVMTVSCQLRQITSSLFSYQSDDDKQCSMGFGNDENIDTFNLVGNDYFFSPDDKEHGQIYGSCSNYEADVNQDTVLGISTSITTSSNSFVLTEAANKSSGNSSKKHELEHDVDIDIEKPCFEESIKLCPERTSRNTGSMGVKSVQEVCDETALVAYKLIGSMLDKLLKTEGIDADMLTRSHLNGGLPVPADLQGTEVIIRGPTVSFMKCFVLNESVIDCPIYISGAEDLLKTSKENARSHIFGQAVEELVPSLSKRYWLLCLKKNYTGSKIKEQINL